MLVAVAAVPPPSKPASRACVASGSIGGSAPFHSAYPEPAGEIWTPANTDGLNGSNPASYNEDSSSTTILNHSVYRARGWRLQARVVGNVTLATNAPNHNGPAGHFIVVAAGYASAVWAIDEGTANGGFGFTSAWVDVSPSASLASIVVQTQVTRYAPSNSSNDNITWNSASVEFQWVNP
jgi:hypothetical protein